MTFTEKQVQDFFERIDKLDRTKMPKFGEMNVNQMVCHCTDFFRMANGSKKALEYGVVDPNHILKLSRSGKTAPAPKGFGQTEGNGTAPIDLASDKEILKEHLLEFSKLDKDYAFAEHPYFGNISFEKWMALAAYHLDHHLKQFHV